MQDQMQLFFKNLEGFLHDIAAIGNKLDVDSILMAETYRKLVEIGVLRLLLPFQLGGLGGDKKSWLRFVIEMAGFSGALLFLNAQNHFAIARLAKYLPNKKIENLLISSVNNDMGLGICFDDQKKLLQVERKDSHFIISGRTPWVSGWTYFPQILLSFFYQDHVYFAVFPLNNTNAIELSPVIKTAIFESTNTVSVTFKDWVIPENEILVQVNPSTEPFEHPSTHAFAGVAKAILNLVQKGKYFKLPPAQEKYHCLQEKWAIYYDKIMSEGMDPNELRAEGLLFVEECALFARMICGAEVLLVTHPLNRLMREVWQYTIAGYNNDLANSYVMNLPIKKFS